MSSVPPVKNPLDDLYSFIQAIYDQIVWQTGGMKQTILDIQDGTHELVHDMPLRIEDVKVTLVDGIRSIKSAIDVEGDQVVARVAAKIDGLVEGQSSKFDTLAQMIITSNSSILAAITESNRHMEELFGNLDVVMGKLIEGLGEKLAESLKVAFENMGGFVDRLERTIAEKMDLNTRAIEDLDGHLTVAVQNLQGELKIVREQHTQDVREQTKALVEGNLANAKTLVQGMNEAISKQSNSLGFAVTTLGSVQGGAIAVQSQMINVLGLVVNGIILADKAERAADKLKWAPVLGGLFTLWTTVIEPLMKNPEAMVADALASVIKEYYKVGRDVYDTLDLSDEKVP